MGNFLNFLAAAGKYAAQHKKDIVKVGTAIAVTAAVTYGLTSKKKDKVYKQLMEQHDKDTAQRLTKEFETQLNVLLERVDNNEMKSAQLESSIKSLCNEFGIDPKIILD